MFETMNNATFREQQIEFLQNKNHKEFMKAECLKKNIDRVVINVGGSRHECYISTIQNFPDTRLFWIAETALAMENANVESSEFFFDRHPGCFENILNYCRTGRLHCPKDVCGPLFQEELEFWGVDELMMQPCCWPNYSEYREVNKNLKIFHVEEEEHCSTENELDELLKENEPRINISKKIWDFLETPKNSYYANIVAGVNIFIVILSIATFCLSTEKLFNNHKEVFASFEKFYCTFFTLDLFLRIFSCPSKTKLFKDYLTWFDIVSLLPFYCELAFNVQDIGFLLPFRLFRIFRLLRYVKNLRGMIVIGETLKASFEQLLLLIMVLTIPMVVFATMVYYAEKNNDSNFESIPRSFWWAIITLTTVGYGDMSPSSLAGKIIGGVCASFGILMVALPISIIGSNFSFYYSYAKAKMELPKHENKVLVDPNRKLQDKLDGNYFIGADRKCQSILNAENEENNAKHTQTRAKDSITFINLSEIVETDNENLFENKVSDNDSQHRNFNKKRVKTSFQCDINKPCSDETIDDECITSITSINSDNAHSYKEFGHKRSKSESSKIDSSKLEIQGRSKVWTDVPTKNYQIKPIIPKKHYASLEEEIEEEVSDKSTVINNGNQINKWPIKNRSFTTFDRKTRSFTTTDETSFSDFNKDYPRCSVELNKLNYENKQIIHLDIAQYQPKKITKKDRANIRKKLFYRNTIHK